MPKYSITYMQDCGYTQNIVLDPLGHFISLYTRMVILNIDDSIQALL